MQFPRTLLALALLAMGGAARAASTLYAATSIGPFKSTDGGLTWKQTLVTTTDPLLQGLPIMYAIAVDPQTPSTVYAMARFNSASGIRLAFVKSSDSAATWSVVSKPTFSYGASGSGLLVIDPVKTNVIYTIDNGGSALEVSTDGGVTWSTPTIPKPAGAVSGGTANQPNLAGVATDPNHSGVVYVVGPSGGVHIGKGYVLKSTDFGNTWSVLTMGAGFGSRIFINPKNSQEMYGTSVVAPIGCTAPNGGQCGIYKSSDGGQSWAELNIPAALVETVAIDNTPGLLYATSDDGAGNANVFTSADGGNTWTTALPGIGGSGGPRNVVRADPNAASTAYAVVLLEPSEISKTTDGGKTWTTVQLLGCGSVTQVVCTNAAVIWDLVVAPSQQSPPPLPVITNVENGASFQQGGVTNSWVTILGTNLSPTTDNWSNSIVNGALPITLDGVSVSMGGQPAYMYYITPGQLNVLAPDIIPGTVAVTVTTPSGTSAAVTAAISLYGPAFFLWPGSQVVATRQDYSYAVAAGTFAGVTTVPAKPGDVLILWATGFGPTNPLAPDGVVVPGTQTYSTSAVAVTIDNLPATVYGAALASGAVGLYQVAIQVPSTLSDGDWPIQARIGGTSSPSGSVLSIAH